MVGEGEKGRLPLIVLNLSRDVIDLLYTNSKGLRKSIETGKLWSLFKETGRLLPYTMPGEPARHTKTPHLVSIQEKGKWIEAVVKTDSTKAEDRKKNDVTAAVAVEVKENNLIIEKLIDIIHRRKQNLPEGSYTAYLFKEGVDKIKKKLGEEAVELLISRDRDNTVYETADLLYHLLVFLEAKSIGFNEVLKELASRMDKE